MQYRTPGRTVTIELSAGHSRTGASGREDFRGSGVSQPPLIPALHGGAAGGVSIRGPRSCQPMAMPPAKSTIENNVISPAAPKPMTTVSDLGEPALAARLIQRHAKTGVVQRAPRNISRIWPCGVSAPPGPCLRNQAERF